MTPSTRSRLGGLATALTLTLTLAAGAALAQTTTTQTTVTTSTGMATTTGTGMAAGMPMASPGAPLSKGDRQFVMMANQGNLTEMGTSALAATKSNNADVKAFAQQMIDDHSSADGKLMALAQDHGITLPKTMDAHHQAAVNRLQRGKSGATFDKFYVQQMVHDHAMTVKMFEKAANDPKCAPDVRQYASDTLPTLREHQAKVLELQAAMKG